VWRERAIQHAFLLIALVFTYTTILNVYDRPEDIKIASLFIGAIILVSLHLFRAEGVEPALIRGEVHYLW
jgi:hypothetical protein